MKKIINSHITKISQSKKNSNNNDNNDNNDNNRKKQSNNKKFECNDCGKMFGTSGVLQRHKSSKHSHSKCDRCDINHVQLKQVLYFTTIFTHQNINVKFVSKDISISLC